MPIEDTKKIFTTPSLAQANAYLAAGWTLLSAVEIPVEDTTISKYTLAWQKAGEPVNVPYQPGW